MAQRPTFDPAIQTEDIGFRADELVACGKCARQNPPSRFECMYCGGGLAAEPTRVGGLKFNARKLESWEKGFNIVVDVSAGDVHALGRMLDIAADDVAKFIDAASPLPIARVESEADARFVAEQAAASGVACRVTGDADLAVDKPLTRLRSIEIDEGAIKFLPFNKGVPVIDAAVSDLVLAVTGRIDTSKTDSLEKRKRGGIAKVLDESSVVSDSAVIDLYLRADATGFRIFTTGFDFSCLGEDKGMIALENMRLLIVRLKEIVPGLKVVNNYARVRHLLDHVWPIESRKDPQGLVRSGFGKKEFGISESTNNVQQFTKYSRLQWQLL